MNTVPATRSFRAGLGFPGLACSLSFKGTNFGGFLRLNSVLWGVSHTLINTVSQCVNQIVRDRVEATLCVQIV